MTTCVLQTKLTNLPPKPKSSTSLYGIQFTFPYVQNVAVYGFYCCCSAFVWGVWVNVCVQSLFLVFIHGADCFHCCCCFHFFLLLRCAGFLFIIVVWLAAEHIKHNVCVMTRKFYLVWLLSDKCSLRFCLRLGPLALPILSTALFLPLSSGFFLSRSSHPYCVNSYTLFIVLFSIVVCIVIFGLLVDNLHLLRFFFTQRALATFCPDKLWLFGRLFPIRVWLRMRVSLVGKFICIYLIIVHYMWLFVNFPFLLLASRTKFALTVSNAACMRVK